MSGPEALRVRGSNAATGQRALAGLIVLGTCSAAGSWLSFTWPKPEAHAALPMAERGVEQAVAPARELLAEFETRAPAPDIRDQRARQLAGMRVHGLVLAPGEGFDFAARVLDQLGVPCSAGALDQLASTLHAAVLFEGLPILERAPQARPSYYIKLGLDAEVRPGGPNLRFQNDRSSPVALDVRIDAGRVRARVHGAASELRVTWIRDLRPSAPIPERSELDPTLPRGMRVLSQRGTPGFEVHVQRAIVDRTPVAPVLPSRLAMNFTADTLNHGPGELEIDGGTPRCVRVMIHLTTDKSRDELHHVYLEGARGLRDDLPA